MSINLEINICVRNMGIDMNNWDYHKHCSCNSHICSLTTFMSLPPELLELES